MNPLFDKFDGEVLDTTVELEVSISFDANSGTYEVYLGSTKITNALDTLDLATLEEAWDEANEEHKDNDQFVDPYLDRGVKREDFV